MAARAKTRQRGGNTLETKAGFELETKEAAADPAAEPKVKDRSDEIKALADMVARLETKNAEAAKEAHVEEGKKGKGKADPLIEQKQDAIILELKGRVDALAKAQAEHEKKSQRPMMDGRESYDFDDIDAGGERKSGDFDLEYKSAFETWVRYNDDSELKAIQRDLMERKDMASLSAPDGGYFVYEDLDTEINRILLDSGGFREHARVRTISTQLYKKRARVGGVDAGWVGEKDSRARTGTPQYEEIKIPVGELYARPAVTQTLLEDAAIDIESEIAQEVADAFLLLENAAFVSGDGSDDKPRGLLTYGTQAAATSWGKFQHTLSGATTGIAGSNPGDELNKLIDMQHTLKTAYRGTASWYVNDATLAYLRKLRDADGRPFLTTDLSNGLPTMHGSAVRVIHEFPDMASNALAIGYGDLARTYTILDRLGSTMERFYDSNTAPFVEFYTRKRLGGGVEFFEAFKFMKFATA